jgi:uncharacterized protein YdcH (DUF465 family)
MPEDSLKEELINHDDGFRSLHEQHQAYERQLETIQQSPYSSEDEMEMKRIKMCKLALKDQMEAVLIEHRRERTAVPA